MPTKNVLFSLVLGVLAFALAYAAPSKLIHTNSDNSATSVTTTPGQVLYRDALEVVDNIQDFLVVIREFEKVKLEEGDRELQIESYSLQRNKKDGGFKTSSWRRKRRSTMEDDLISAAYLGSLDTKAEEMVSSIQTFLNDLKKVCLLYCTQSC